MFIQIIVAVVGITKTITVPFRLFIQTIVSVVGLPKAMTVPFSCLLGLL